MHTHTNTHIHKDDITAAVEHLKVLKIQLEEETVAGNADKEVHTLLWFFTDVVLTLGMHFSGLFTGVLALLLHFPHAVFIMLVHCFYTAPKTL
jgi:hypothetical protein